MAGSRQVKVTLCLRKVRKLCKHIHQKAVGKCSSAVVCAHPWAATTNIKKKTRTLQSCPTGDATTLRSLSVNMSAVAAALLPAATMLLSLSATPRHRCQSASHKTMALSSLCRTPACPRTEERAGNLALKSCLELLSEYPDAETKKIAPHFTCQGVCAPSSRAGSSASLPTQPARVAAAQPGTGLKMTSIRGCGNAEPERQGGPPCRSGLLAPGPASTLAGPSGTRNQGAHVQDLAQRIGYVKASSDRRDTEDIPRGAPSQN